MLSPCIVIYIFFVNETYFLRGLDKDTPEGTCRIILSPFDDGIGHGQKPVYGNFPYTPLLLMNTVLADMLNESSIYNHNKDPHTASSTFDSVTLKCLYLRCPCSNIVMLLGYIHPEHCNVPRYSGA
jgi:hypothetical protein